MVESTVTYESFTLAREYPHSPEKVFRNFSDPARKRKWFAEGEGSILQSFEMDFRVGGKETGVFLMNPGPVAGLVCRNDSWYMDIVENKRIVIACTMTLGENRISASLSTIELLPQNSKTLLRFTEQAAFFEGADGADIRRAGWQVLLEQLGGALDAEVK